MRVGMEDSNHRNHQNSKSFRSCLFALVYKCSIRHVARHLFVSLSKTISFRKLKRYTENCPLHSRFAKFVPNFRRNKTENQLPKNEKKKKKCMKMKWINEQRVNNKQQGPAIRTYNNRVEINSQTQRAVRQLISLLILSTREIRCYGTPIISLLLLRTKGERKSMRISDTFNVAVLRDIFFVSLSLSSSPLPSVSLFVLPRERNRVAEKTVN